MRQQQREREFSEFYTSRGPSLRRSAYLIVRDWHTAEDLTQQTMVRLYAAWPRIRRETSDAYARRAVVNACLSHLRRHRPERPTDRIPDHEHVVDEEPRLDLAEALALLPPRQRAIIALRFVEDLSVAQVAQTLDLAEGTVKSQTSRALQTLRTHLPALVTPQEYR